MAMTTNRGLVLLALFMALMFLACKVTNQDSPQIPRNGDSGQDCVIEIGPELIVPTSAHFSAPENETKGRFIFILIDRSRSYRRHTEYSIQLLIEVLPQIVRPADRVFIGWIGIETDDPEKIIFLGQVPSTNNISPASTPERPPRFIPTPSEVFNENLTTVQQEQQRQSNLDIERRNIREAQEVACRIADWNNRIGELSRKEQERVNRETQQQLEDFNIDLISALMNVEYDVPDEATYIYEGFYFASRLRQNDKHDYSDYLMLIFSDMTDTGGQPRNLPIDISGFRVVVANFYCPQLTECINRQAQWETELKDLNGEFETRFIDSYETDEQALLDVFNIGGNDGH